MDSARSWARAAALVAAATLLLATPAIAVAEDRWVRDARGDYWHDHRGDGETPDQHAPDWGDPDLRRALFRHTDDEVRVRLKMSRLAPRDGGYWRMNVSIRTDEGLVRRAELFKAHDGRPSVDWSGDRPCAVEHVIDYADDVFVLAVPRRCLSRPARVELKAATRWWPTSDDNAYLDVAGTAGFRMGRWSAPLSRD